MRHFSPLSSQEAKGLINSGYSGGVEQEESHNERFFLNMFMVHCGNH